jgi:hypothetical protein
MRRVVLTLLAVLVAACNGAPTPPSPLSNSPGPPPPLPPASSATLISIWVCCGGNQVTVGTSRQLEARATWSNGITDITHEVTDWRSSDPQIATISETGMVTSLRPGDVTISISFRDKQASWGLRMWQSPRGPAEAGEITGQALESTRFGDIEIWGAEGEYENRKAQGTFGFFRIEGVETPGRDLFVRRRGYSAARITVPHLGYDAGDIYLQPDPSMVSEAVEGPVCRGRTATASFVPSGDGFLLITRVLQQATFRDLYEDGILVHRRVPLWTEVPIAGGRHYEFRIQGADCDSPDTPMRMTFLRTR